MLRERNNQGKTPLHLAVESGKLESVVHNVWFHALMDACVMQDGQ